MWRSNLTADHEANGIIMDSVSSNIKEYHWMEKSNHAILLDKEYEEVVSLRITFVEKISENLNKYWYLNLYFI